MSYLVIFKDNNFTSSVFSFLWIFVEMFARWDAMAYLSNFLEIHFFLLVFSKLVNAIWCHEVNSSTETFLTVIVRAPNVLQAAQWPCSCMKFRKVSHLLLRITCYYQLPYFPTKFLQCLMLVVCILIVYRFFV